MESFPLGVGPDGIYRYTSRYLVLVRLQLIIKSFFDIFPSLTAKTVRNLHQSGSVIVFSANETPDVHVPTTWAFSWNTYVSLHEAGAALPAMPPPRLEPCTHPSPPCRKHRYVCVSMWTVSRTYLYYIPYGNWRTNTIIRIYVFTRTTYKVSEWLHRAEPIHVQLAGAEERRMATTNDTVWWRPGGPQRAARGHIGPHRAAGLFGPHPAAPDDTACRTTSYDQPRVQHCYSTLTEILWDY